ncbi:MAG: hypothetical protein AAF436_20900, partial [Myxococcota bacterium]
MKTWNVATLMCWTALVHVPALGLILAVSGSVALAQLDPTVDPSTSTTSSVPPPPPPVTREMIEAP